MDNGMIECTRLYNPYTRELESVSYKWKNGPICRITTELAEDLGYKWGDRYVTIGPYRIRVIDHEAPYGVIKGVRVDWPLWWVVPIAFGSTRLLRLAYHRTIITLAVWNLAQVDLGVMPSWCDIRVVRRIREWALSRKS